MNAAITNAKPISAEAARFRDASKKDAIHMVATMHPAAAAPVRGKSIKSISAFRSPLVVLKR
jgi:hypothetical protein